jgi:DNA-binding GntR family transcriptional regulator
MRKRPKPGNFVGGVVEAIELGIRQGRYLPGDQLVERDLAVELGVSRIPVREALRRLAAQRILDIRTYRGAVVRTLSRREAIDVMDILKMLGVLTVSRAAERINEGDHRRKLEALISREASRKKREQKIKEWIDINFPFYQLIAEISGNRLAPDLSRQFQLQMYRLASDVRLDPALKSSTVKDHLAIARAILAGNVKSALKAYERHFAHTLQCIETMPDSAFASEGSVNTYSQ